MTNGMINSEVDHLGHYFEPERRWGKNTFTYLCTRCGHQAYDMIAEGSEKLQARLNEEGACSGADIGTGQ